MATEDTETSEDDWLNEDIRKKNREDHKAKMREKYGY